MSLLQNAQANRGFSQGQTSCSVRKQTTEVEDLRLAQGSAHMHIHNVSGLHYSLHSKMVSCFTGGSVQNSSFLPAVLELAGQAEYVRDQVAGLHEGAAGGVMARRGC